jgi:hypothetical protein
LFSPALHILIHDNEFPGCSAITGFFCILQFKINNGTSMHWFQYFKWHCTDHHDVYRKLLTTFQMNNLACNGLST